LKGAVKTDNNSTKRKHSVTDKTVVTWKEKFFVAGISGIENVYIQFYSPDVHYTVFFKYFSLV
jgi:uncharacterized protein (DUF2236 family)